MPSSFIVLASFDSFGKHFIDPISQFSNQPRTLLLHDMMTIITQYQ